MPAPSDGVDFSKEESVVVPDQSMSLQEILERFTRGEPLPVMHETQYGDDDLDNPLNEDLEKMANADLVDKAEYRDRLKEVQVNYEKQEKIKSAKKAKEAAEMAEKERESAIQAEVEKRLNKSA